MDYVERWFGTITNKSVVLWNSMIGGYALNGKPLESFYCSKKMLEDDNLHPDAITSINVLPSCAQIGALLPAKTMHKLELSYRVKLSLVLPLERGFSLIWYLRPLLLTCMESVLRQKFSIT